LMLPLAWISATFLGAWLGSFLGDPKQFGADFAFTALFIGLIAGFWQGRITLFTVAASGAVSALTYVTAGPPWHVAAGAFAGIAAAYCAGTPEDQE
jgi:predicted branched-subunit amino acid permease